MTKEEYKKMPKLPESKSKYGLRIKVVWDENKTLSVFSFHWQYNFINAFTLLKLKFRNPSTTHFQNINIKV